MLEDQKFQPTTPEPYLRKVALDVVLPIVLLYLFFLSFKALIHGDGAGILGMVLVVIVTLGCAHWRSE